MDITPIRNGYWITAHGVSEYGEEIPHALEKISDRLGAKLDRLREEIMLVEAERAEVEAELASRGGRIRPRRVPMPDSSHWASTCCVCGVTNHNLNMCATEVSLGRVKIFCRGHDPMKDR